MSIPQRSIRLLGRSESSLNSISSAPGEMFYDTTNQTLRIYHRTGASTIATEDYVDAAVSNIDLSGINLTGYATETYVTTRGYITSTALSSYALTSALSSYALTSAIPTNTNQLTNGANYITASSLTGLATESFVGTAISNLIDTAPTALNTLNELAAALNDDANFATTVTTALGTKAPINNPTFTGTVGGITKAMVGLGNVLNVAQEPAITAGTTAQYFRGDKTFQTLNATAVGLGNVTNESKATMFASPTFTGTVAGVTATHVGLGNVTNESKATMFASPTFTGTVAGVTATHVGLGNVTNESKATMFSSPTFTGTVAGVTATHVGLGNVTNESKATMFSSPTFTGTTTLQQSTEVLTQLSSATGTVAHNFGTGSIWYHSSISADFTANFTNVPTTNNRTIACTLILVQGATARIPTAVQIDGVGQTIKWLGSASAPTGNANKVDIVSFTLIRTGTAWAQVLGSLTTYG